MTLPQHKELKMSSTRPQARGEISRLDVIRLLAFSMLLILPANSMAQQSPPIAEQIARTYGLDSFGQIEAIRYTWNLETPPSKFHACGSGARRPTPSPTRGKTRTAGL
jgi:hypothetical protein